MRTVIPADFSHRTNYHNRTLRHPGSAGILPATLGHQFSAFDGNGNVRALVKADAVNPSGSAITARYAYDGFGKEVAVTGADAGKNAFRFSTKQLDAETGMNYYGYRYYSADAGRWINRDPIKERGGMNIYVVAKNNSVLFFDVNGLKCPCVVTCPDCIAEKNSYDSLKAQLDALINDFNDIESQFVQAGIVFDNARTDVVRARETYNMNRNSMILDCGSALLEGVLLAPDSVACLDSYSTYLQSAADLVASETAYSDAHAELDESGVAIIIAREQVSAMRSSVSGALNAFSACVSLKISCISNGITKGCTIK